MPKPPFTFATRGDLCVTQLWQGPRLNGAMRSDGPCKVITAQRLAFDLRYSFAILVWRDGHTTWGTELNMETGKPYLAKE